MARSYCDTAGHTPRNDDPNHCAMCGTLLASGTALEVARVGCASCGVTDRPLDLDVTATPPEHVCRKCKRKPRCPGCDRRVGRLVVHPGGDADSARCGDCNRRAERDWKHGEAERVAFADRVVACFVADVDKLGPELAALRVPGVMEALVAYYEKRAIKEAA